MSSTISLAYCTDSFAGTGRHQYLNLNYVFRTKNASKKTGCVPLQCRINISGKKAHKDVEIATEQNIPIEYWDIENKCVKKECPDYEQMTAQLETFKTTLQAYFTILTSKTENLSPQELKEAYQNKATGKPVKTAHTLLKAIDNLITDFEKKVYLPEDSTEKRSKETLKQWNSTRTKLIEYLTFRKTKVKPFISRKQQRSKTEQAEYISNGKQYDVALTDIQPVFAEEFYLYLTVDRNAKLQHAAANKQIKNTKQVFTYAVTKGQLQVNPLAYYRTADADSEVIPLAENEVQAIINATDLVQRVERIRDCFVVQIYTGYAFQDLQALTIENIYKEPTTGVYFLCRERGKTGIDEMVPILPEVKRMIDKYALDPECRAKGVLFPVPSNTCYNQYLKELQTHCKITTKLTSHLGRHTFADRMLNLYGFSLEIVSRMLGHKSIRTTQHYCKVSLKRIAEAFAPELVIERPKLTVIHSIKTTYQQYGIAA